MSINLNILFIFEELFWTYLAIPVLILLGLYFSLISNWFQLRSLSTTVAQLKTYIHTRNQKHSGVSPLHTFFASLGSCVGIGNMVGICTAVQVGGPGAVLWMWFAALLGMLVKYAEIYLGILYRQKTQDNSFIGGPMIYLQRLPGGKTLSYLTTIFMCLYGIEIFIFRTMTSTIATQYHISENLIIPFLIFAIIAISKNGIKLVGKVSSYIIPLFTIFFVMLSIITLWYLRSDLTTMFANILKSAFSYHAPIGAFAGSSIIQAISHGMKRACYTGDIGTGYAATIHSESSESDPHKEGSLAFIEIIVDTFIICTLAVFIILITGAWQQPINENELVPTALAHFFPWIHTIWPISIFILGYSSITSFYAVGQRAATFLHAKHGKLIYGILTTICFLASSQLEKGMYCLSIMSIIQMLLLVLNLYRECLKTY